MIIHRSSGGGEGGWRGGVFSFVSSRFSSERRDNIQPHHVVKSVDGFKTTLITAPPCRASSHGCIPCRGVVHQRSKIQYSPRSCLALYTERPPCRRFRPRQRVHKWGAGVRFLYSARGVGGGRPPVRNISFFLNNQRVAPTTTSTSTTGRSTEFAVLSFSSMFRLSIYLVYFYIAF